MVSLIHFAYDEIVKIVNRNTNGQWINRDNFMKELSKMFDIKIADKTGNSEEVKNDKLF